MARRPLVEEARTADSLKHALSASSTGAVAIVGLSVVSPKLASCILATVMVCTGMSVCLWELQQPRMAGRVEPCILGCLAGVCALCVPLPLVSLPHVAGMQLQYVAPTIVGGAVLLELGHRRWLSVDPVQLSSLDSGVDRTAHENSSRGTVAWAQEQCKRHLYPEASSGRGIGSVFLGVHVLVSCFHTNIDFVMTEWRKTLVDVLQARDRVGFKQQLLAFCAISVSSLVVSVYSRYLSHIWDLLWREELTHDFVELFLGAKAFYRMRALRACGSLDNPDQRLVEDVALFTSQSRALLCGALDAAIKLSVFLPALVRLSPSPVVWQVCFLTATVSSVLTHVVGRTLAGQTAGLQITEANLRSSLMRVWMFAENIALQQGEAGERILVLRHFEAVKAATWLVARSALQLAAFTTAYGLGNTILPVLLLVPHYFNGTVSLGLMFQLEGIMMSVQASVNFFVGSYAQIADWRATAGRLVTIADFAHEKLHVEPPSELLTASCEAQCDLVVEDLTLVSTRGKVLVQGVTFTLRAAETAFLVGLSEEQQSALLRMLAGGLPAFPAGRVLLGSAGGAMLIPSGGLFLPQVATLRDCLTGSQTRCLADRVLRENLVSCDLEALVDHLDAMDDWGAALSLSDRQRLVFARLLSSWPLGVRWLLLDGMDSTLCAREAHVLYDRLVTVLPCHSGIIARTAHVELLGRCGWRGLQISGPAGPDVDAESVVAGLTSSDAKPCISEAIPEVTGSEPIMLEMATSPDSVDAKVVWVSSEAAS